jgi:ArsR family transcriptional regulator, arsenate/arsenite/antimonite-responsive transcriptional repressor
MPKQVSLPVLGQDQRTCCAPLTRAPLDAGEAARLAQVLKALADPARLRLLSLIGSHDGGEACVCDLTEAFDLTAPTISHHLKVLREAGLITADRRGTWVYYRLAPAALADLAGLFTPALEPVGAR